MAKLNNVDSFLDLLRKVVADVDKKTNSPTRSMTLAVLNNRLLQKTLRRFNPRDYGATNLRELLETLQPALELSLEKGGPMVIFRDLSVTSAELKNKASASEDFEEGGRSTSGRIRNDLWMAIMDYSGGSRYVWDERRGVARTASQEDQEAPSLPTVTPDELDDWRSKFLASNEATLAPTDLVLANRWRNQRLPTSSLPSELQQSWNKELNRRVRQRLSTFFASREKIAHDDERDQQDPTEIAPVADEELAAALNAGDFFPVGELLARRLEQNSHKTVSTVLAQMVVAWSSSKGPLFQPESMSELISRLDSLPNESVALALVNAVRRLRKGGIQALDTAVDLNFKLHKNIALVFGNCGETLAERHV